MATRTHWSVNDAASFASISVQLAPQADICCESDAVVSFSQGVQVRGYVNSIWNSLAKVFFTGESFFATVVWNSSTAASAHVLLAPTDPGGIVLHHLRPGGGDLLLTKGAYVASDSTVKVTSEVQSGYLNPIFSRTGFFLLRASGGGVVACAAYGAVHTYTLQPGDVRAVDNGHLVAWSASMRYQTGWASQGGIVDSMTSGEGLMCFFEGPGTVYVQSHKPNLADEPKRAGSGSLAPFLLFIIVFLLFLLLAFSS